MRTLILSFLLFLAFPVWADEISLSLTQKSRMADDDTYQSGGWEGAQISYKFDTVYVFASQESTAIHTLGKAFDYSMTGLGVGTKIPLSKRVNLFGQVGFYKVKNSWGSTPRRERNEGLIYYLNDRYSNDGKIQNFDAFSVENENTVAGEIGIELMQPVTDSVNMGFSISYRQMKIKEIVHGYNDAWRFAETGENWEYGVSRNHSTVNFGLVSSYVF